MIGLLHRVTQARVEIDGRPITAIGPGLLVLVGIEREDTQANVDRLLDRLLGYRVFPDDSGRMNRSLQDTGGALLLVPQFTLAADTTKGMRASFSRAAPPETGKALFESLVECARRRHHDVAAGRFGADMQVALTNDGPVTFILDV
ncbi:MAG: D-tyrosyl-tRNA(Tyr) deacylase [Gammaproteobacteria bacterium]|nr:D-tyrosyl-tRNA(Tyr) deacylase [Gammaproteobacteria bacterium]